MHAGKKIKILRTIRNLSQQQLADRINRTRALVSHIEQSGKVNHYTLLEILKVFKMTEAEFINYHPKEISSPYSGEDLKKEVTELKDQLSRLKKDYENLEEKVELYKKLIQSLEKRK